MHRFPLMKTSRSIFAPAAALVMLLAATPAVADTAPLPPGDRPAPDVFSRLERAGNAADHGGAAYVIVYDEARNHVQPSGVTYVDGYFLYKTLTAAGCRDLSVLRWNYDPQSSYVEVREVNIIRGGRRIAVDVTQVRDLPAPQAAIYWKDRIKTLQLPRLQIGDGIEVTTFRKGFTYALLDGAGEGAPSAPPDDERYIPPMPGEYFDIVLFAAGAPVVEKRYVLDLPADKRLHSEIYNGPLFASTTYSGERTEYAWWGFDLSPRPNEPRQPDASDDVVKVVMATVENWEAKSRWFFEINRDQFEVTPAIQAKVDEILREAGLARAPEEARAKALLHWVAQNIRYSGQTMGPGEGFTLHPGPMIFKNRSGVCKDIAGMLITMMRAAGMDSYAAMTMAGSRIETVPADQFNHAVTALRRADGAFVMYDPTWVPYNNDIWSLLEAEQHYVIGTPGGETLMRIPYSPPHESPLRIEHEAELRADGTLAGTLKLSGSGAMDGRLRRMIAYTGRRELGHALATLLAPAGERVEALRWEHRDPADFSADMWITISYRIPRFAQDVGGALELKSPMMQVVLGDVNLFRAGASRWADKRQTDVFLYYTQLIEGNEKIRLPRGFTAAQPPVSREIDETYAYFKGTSRMSGRSLVIEQRTEIRRRQIPPDGYAGFKAAVDEAWEWGAASYRIEKGGAR